MSKKEKERVKAILILFAIEMLAAAIVTMLVACVVIPIAYAERGYWAVGGEMLFLMVVACVSYTVIHNIIFAEAKKGGKSRGRDKTPCRRVSGHTYPARGVRGCTATGVAKTGMDY